MKRYFPLAIAISGSAVAAVQPAQVVQGWVAALHATRGPSTDCQWYEGIVAGVTYPKKTTGDLKYIQGNRYKLDLDPSFNKSLLELYGSINGFEATDAWDDDGDALRAFFYNAKTPQYIYAVGLFEEPGEYTASTNLCVIILGVRK